MDLATAQTLLRDQHVALVILFDTHHNLAIGVCVEIGRASCRERV